MSIPPSNLPQVEATAEPAHASPSRSKCLALGLFSVLIPGLGQLLTGKRRQGTILSILFVVLLLAFWPFRVLRYYSGFLALFFSWTALYLYASCNAALAQHLPRPARPSKWWLVLVVPVTFITLSLIGAGITRGVGFRSFKVPSTGMEPTIREGDQIVADMHFYRSHPPQRFETILFRRGKTFFIKRVIAVGGDTIEGRKGNIYLNGNELNESYIEHIGQPPLWLENFGPISVPPGKYFVIGDNRDYSLDSRSSDYGLVDSNSIVGKPLYIYGSDRTHKKLN